MYSAQPLAEEGETVTPTVTLIEMTRRPLQVMAAAAELYRGGVYRNPTLITREQALEWLDGFKQSKISAPLEFITLHFFIEGVTRAFTHQLVRQRTAVFVQESMRFAVKDNAEYEIAIPPSIAELKDDDPKRVIWNASAQATAVSYNSMIAAGIPAEDARGILPTNITTRIHYHTDLRNFVSTAGMRLCSQAQYEWKIVWSEFIKAILNFGPKEDRWQQKAIARLFQPVCYQTGSCGFNGPADRYCSIRDRVNTHSAAGDPPITWVDINPLEPLHHAAARKPQ
jgi:flavin-dependent thymidylate synthase